MALWEYYLSAPIDGKSPGWHPYTATASAMLSALVFRNNLTDPSRTTFHVRSGYFHYEVNLLSQTQRNTKTGTVRPIRPPSDPEQPSSKRHKPAPDPQLAPLFAGPAGHVWDALLTPILASLPDAQKFIGSSRDTAIHPPRPLTFQALLPLPPADWRVVVLGQNPYPRAESATGIALFDAQVTSWDSPNFGKASTLRNIIKAAAMAKHDAAFETTIHSLRTVLNQNDVVSPPQWFRAMLAQGMLLLNAALTTGGNGITAANHASFWRPVIKTIVEEILLAKSALPDDDSRRGVLLLWWGNEALKVKKKLKTVFDKYEGTVPVVHLDWCNPAAQGDKFCKEPKHLVKVNEALKELGQKEIDVLPDENWLKKEGPRSEIFGKFITDTQKLHKMYLERLQNGLDGDCQLKPITGILKQELCSVVEACEPVGLEGQAGFALKAVEQLETVGELTKDERGAVYLYTGNSMYHRLNSALRSPNRSKVDCYFKYLNLFIRAHGKISPCPATLSLYRGINKKLGDVYKEGSSITWWNVSSCSSNKSVSEGFAGGGTLFHVAAKTAVPIMKLSAYQSEEEYVLAPGTQLRVAKVTKKKNTLTEIFLEELEDGRLVS